MEYPILIFLHVLFGIMWAGAAVTIGLFIIPAVLDAGPAGGAVMAGVARRGLPVALTIAGAIVVLTGVRLFSIRFSPEWIRHPEGIVLGLGGLLGIVALVVGVFVQKPTAHRLGVLGGQIAASGAPPSAEHARELQALRQRLGKTGRLMASLLILTAVLMAVHRLAAGL